TEAAEAVWEAERATLAAALDQRHSERSRLVDLYQVGEIKIPELKQRVADVAEKISVLEERLTELEGQRPEPAPEASEDLLAELRRRLDAGLDDRQRQEIVSLLAEVVMNTECAENGRKRLTAVVTYKFPGVADACTDARAGTTEIP
ncbi:MAG: hypothetical protein Q8S13_06330, partial [Dehalococcoidia bacterium]|nr:hypothetical protein [Dehalococcoidia bacterium]